jgi:hypothetical protein
MYRNCARLKQRSPISNERATRSWKTETVAAADQPIALPPPANALDPVAALHSLPPPEVVLTKAWAAPSPDMVGSLIETRLLEPAVEARPNFEYAPYAVVTDESAGSNGISNPHRRASAVEPCDGRAEIGRN